VTGRVLIEACQRAGKIDREKLIDTIEAMSEADLGG